MSLEFGVWSSLASSATVGWEQVMVEAERSPVQMERRGILITLLILLSLQL